MDRRTVVALVVIALIFIMLPYYWEYMGFSSSEETPEVQVADSLPGQPEITYEEPFEQTIVDTGLDLHAPPENLFPEAARLDTLPEEFFSVETELYSARISSRGGTLASYKLKKHSYFRGSAIELIAARDDYPLRFTIPEVAGLSTGSLTFGSDRRTIDLTGGGSDSVQMLLSARTPGGVPLNLIYTFRKDTYTIGVRIRAPREGELDRVARLNLVWIGGLDATEDDASGDYGYFSGYVRQAGEVAKFDDFEDGRLKEGSSGEIDWVATKSKYFLVAIRSVGSTAEEFGITATERKTVEKGDEVAKREFNLLLGNRLAVDIDRTYDLYLGPIDYQILTGLGNDLHKTVELGFWLFRPFAIAILWFITAVYSVIPNYGWVIIVFTVVMKLIMFPFSRKNYRQMAKMKALQPKLKALQEKYKEEPQKLNQQMMKFYKEEKFNPLGGCIWMLPQLPIFWALFTVFKAAIELRGASFLWLEDLSQPSLALAILMSLAMLVQQMLTNKDPKQKFMVYGFPVIMFFLFKGFPAGLVLYWTVYNLLSIAEQKSVEASMAAETATAAST